jgi:hypothetical protein
VLHEAERERFGWLTDEKRRHVDYRLAIFPLAHDVEDLHQARQRVRLNGTLDARGAVRRDLVLHDHQVHLVAALDPANHSVVHQRPRSDEIRTTGQRCKLCVEQHVPVV